MTAFLVAKVSRKGEENAAKVTCPRMLLAHEHSAETTKKPRQCRGVFTFVWSGLSTGQRSRVAVAALSGSLLRPEAAITGQLASPPGTALRRPV